MRVAKDDPFHLHRFVEAQDPVYSQVCEQLRGGYKTGDWIWFIFPQIAGLGSSENSRRFAISSLAEAEAYMQHSVLRKRLEECARLVLKVSGKTAHEIFDSPDDLKFRSCMTLFSRTSGKHPVFQDNLTKYFGGIPDPLTTKRLSPGG
jgi:uncharacterized protein (DUF1810 family)